MPELPEVERAVKMLLSAGAGKRICKVDTTEDSIVFAQTTHEQFAAEILGKVFYLELDGEGKMPVLHFGMTGMLHFKGEEPMFYQSRPKDTSKSWPPRYAKFTLHLDDDDSDVVTEVAFTDVRRLGRIRLCKSPRTELPISELGFDPILSMPTLDEFSPMVRRRSCPIKVLLLDQSFSAGVGNWVADEILYNAKIHPEQRCNTLTDSQITSLHYFVANICEIAVAVDADSERFPSHWLFKHRWGKGKKKTRTTTLTLPDGSPATIKWVTIGGRTSAYVAELQRLPSNAFKEMHDIGDSQMNILATDDDADVVRGTRRRNRKRKRSEDIPT
ncbi:hypothetical protein AX14_000001 [Amanita brunnescens Koide BX004]|nr:hypothetical protein AX14_000001 [Amanita brunnescens Koide BX004]